MDLENHSCGHIFCTFKANLIKLHVLVPIRLKRKLKIISRHTCRVKKQFTRPNLIYVYGHIQHLVHVFSGERSRAIMALLFQLFLAFIKDIRHFPQYTRILRQKLYRFSTNFTNDHCTPITLLPVGNGQMVVLQQLVAQYI